jgi:hypothetical protein
MQSVRNLPPYYFKSKSETNPKTENEKERLGGIFLTLLINAITVPNALKIKVITIIMYLSNIEEKQAIPEKQNLKNMD